MIEEKETHKASESLKRFFNRLIETKNYVKAKYEESKDAVLQDIHDRLDAIIKEKKEKREKDDLQ